MKTLAVLALALTLALAQGAAADGMPVEDGRYAGGDVTSLELTDAQLRDWPKERWIPLTAPQRAKLQAATGAAPSRLWLYDARAGESDCTCHARNVAFLFRPNEADVPHEYVTSDDEAAELETEPRVRRGSMSTVELLDVSGPVPAQQVLPSQAPDGHTFYFLVTRLPDVEGLFTLKELRDFTVDGRSYFALTRERVGATFEPHTIVEDVFDFRKDVRPDLAPRVPLDGERIIMYTTIYGADIAYGSSASLVLEVGWGKRVEPFSFTVQLP